MLTLKSFFYKFPENLIKVFSGSYFLWQISAWILTYLIVVSGFDWTYYQFFRHTFIYRLSFSAALIGFLVPVLLPVILLIVGQIKNNPKILNTAYASAQAAFFGWLVSSFYKSITGRDAPPYGSAPITDISRIFHFGFWRSGIFWGWPSSHTTVAFALGVALYQLYPNNKILRFLALFYAVYIGLGVSISIHWFSDFAAGAIIGTIIGIVVGRSFRTRPDRLAILPN
jgi:membrane-associated phospholipid phosphatase